jgi:Putative transmembrane protein (PGPGW)
MYARAKHFTLTRPRLKKTVGWVFIVVGVVALVAPVIPGAPLVFIGFELLGFRLLFVDKLLGREPRTEGKQS